MEPRVRKQRRMQDSTDAQQDSMGSMLNICLSDLTSLF